MNKVDACEKLETLQKNMILGSFIRKEREIFGTRNINTQTIIKEIRSKQILKK